MKKNLLVVLSLIVTVSVYSQISITKTSQQIENKGIQGNEIE